MKIFTGFYNLQEILKNSSWELRFFLFLYMLFIMYKKISRRSDVYALHVSQVQKLRQNSNIKKYCFFMLCKT